MALPKKIKVGVLMLNEVEYKGEKKKLLSLGLGNRNKNKPEYDYKLELVVKDGNGKVVATQSDGFLDLVDPRKEPDDLFKAGIINEEQYNKMKERLEKLPDMIKYEVRMKT
jgi:hypothetical protein